MRKFLYAAFSIVTLIASPAYSNDLSKYLYLNGERVEWERSDGEPITLSFSYVRTKHTFRADLGEGGCERTMGVETLLKHSNVAFTDFHKAVKSAFARWERVTNVRFVYAHNIVDTDILIGAQTKAHFIASVDLKIRPEDGTGKRFLKQAMICLNPELTWTLESADMLRPAFESVFVHEAGHGLGLNDFGKRGAIRMHRRYTGNVELTSIDIAAIETLYGRKLQVMGSARR